MNYYSTQTINYNRKKVEWYESPKKNNEYNFSESDSTSEKGFYTIISEHSVSLEFVNQCEAILKKRLQYLKANLDEEQDTELYSKSVKVFTGINLKLVYTVPPKLSVDNTGYLIAEWRNYLTYDLIAILFRSQEQISLTAIKDKKLIKKVSGIPNEIVEEFYKL